MSKSKSDDDPSTQQARPHVDANEGATSDPPDGQVRKDETDPMPQPDAAPVMDKMHVVGSALWLMTHSTAHRHMFVADLEWSLLPAVGFGQFYLWRRDNVPVGLATWALLSDEVEARITAGNRRLAPAEWHSGENLWLMDFIIPFGGKDAALKELRENVFKDKKAKTWRAHPQGEGVEVVEL